MTIAALVLAATTGGSLYLDLINNSYDRLVAIEAAPAGSGRWQAVELGRPLRGGGDSATVQLQREGCRYDLRMHFSHGAGLLHPDYDVCKGGRYRIGDYRRKARRDVGTP